MLWGTRVVIPMICQKSSLRVAYHSPTGNVKMKSIVSTHIWWPQVNKQIEELVQNCSACQEVHNKPPLAMLHPWSWPACPWQRIHIDFAGPFLGSMVMLVVDANQCCHYRKDFTVTVKPFCQLWIT